MTCKIIFRISVWSFTVQKMVLLHFYLKDGAAYYIFHNNIHLPSDSGAMGFDPSIISNLREHCSSTLVLYSV